MSYVVLIKLSTQQTKASNTLPETRRNPILEHPTDEEYNRNNISKHNVFINRHQDQQEIN